VSGKYNQCRHSRSSPHLVYLARPASIAAAGEHQHARPARTRRQFLEHARFAQPHAGFQGDDAAASRLACGGLRIVVPPEGSQHQYSAVQKLLHGNHDAIGYWCVMAAAAPLAVLATL